MRDDLNGTLIVVSNQDGEEIEVDGSAGAGLLGPDAATAFLIGEAVMKLLLKCGDGEPVEVRYFAQ